METCQGSEFSTFPWRDTPGVPPFVEVLQSVLTDHLPHFSDNFKCWSYTKILVIYRTQIPLRSRGESFKLLKAMQMPCILRSSCSLHVSCQASKKGFAISSNPISSPAWATPSSRPITDKSVRKAFYGQVCSWPRLGVCHLLLVAVHVHMQPTNLHLGCWVINHAGTITY